MINCLIIEDDKLSATFLETIISNNLSNHLNVLGTCFDLDDAKIKIEEFHPDIVFLDIQMSDRNGFTLIEELKKINFELIVTTASPEYAIEAFKVNALDFLVKPIQAEDLIRSIEKFKQKMALVEANTPKIGNNKIGLPTNKGIIFMNPDAISYCQADNTYTNVILDNGTVVIPNTIIM